MSGLQAGIGKTNVTPRVGALLYGYFDRFDPSQGVHDDLWARAIVLKSDTVELALCSVEVCVLRAREVALVRDAVARRCSLSRDNIFLFATHTHAAPSGSNASDWDTPLVDLIADAIVQAYEHTAPAVVSSGIGFLYGYNINRRWMDRPVDPAVGLLKIDRPDGSPLALLGNYACHSVVLGSNNLLISGDWPGYASRMLEEHFGPGFVALFSQGGAGDVNPLTETVRRNIAAGWPVASIYDLTSYYGFSPNAENAWRIDDRRSGTFEECEQIARAYSDQILHICRALEPMKSQSIWVEKVIVNGAAGPDEPPGEEMPAEYREQQPDLQPGNVPLEIMCVGIGDTVLIGHPGESFSETSISVRAACQRLGYRVAMLVTYANGSYAYFPTSNAYEEGGYESSWPRRLGISRYVQDRIEAATMPILTSHITQKTD